MDIAMKTIAILFLVSFLIDTNRKSGKSEKIGQPFLATLCGTISGYSRRQIIITHKYYILGKMNKKINIILD